MWDIRKESEGRVVGYINYMTCIFLATEVTKFLYYHILHEWPEKPQNKQGQIQPVSHMIRTRYLYNAKQERYAL
jgi:hypothetical protein